MPFSGVPVGTKRQTAVFVNEATLLPVLLRLAPSATLLQRFPAELGRVLAAHGGDLEVIGREIAAMSEHATRKTASRSLVGMLQRVRSPIGASPATRPRPWPYRVVRFARPHAVRPALQAARQPRP